MIKKKKKKKEPKNIEFEYTDSDGERHTLQLEGIGSRCVQHELDHLNGIIFLQKLSGFTKMRRSYREARPKEEGRKRLDYEAY